MSKKSQDVVVNLKEIPDEGQFFSFSRSSGELNPHLRDILGNSGEYSIEFTITPLGEAYDLKGNFKADMGLICSRCAYDFKTCVQEDFHELLVVNKELPRNGHLGKTNHTSEGLQDGPFFNELRSSFFSISKFCHEIIALAEPLHPLGKENCDDTCENLIKAQRDGWLKIEENQQSTSGPFSALKELKL
jgi:uncharacterized metal-binding protein YceD (DUF177 family)